jgi:hypothetical protein
VDRGSDEGARRLESPSRQAGTHFATRLRLIFWKMATTFGLFNNCSSMRAVATTMIYTHVLNRGGLGVRSPVDRLGLHLNSAELPSQPIQRIIRSNATCEVSGSPPGLRYG